MPKVMIVGVLDKPESTNVWMAKGFKQNGWGVIPINYRTIISKEGKEVFYDYLLWAVSRYKPELVLFSKINGVNPAIVQKVTEQCTTWYWFMDNIRVAEAIRAEQYVTRVNFASATSSEVVEFFDRHKYTGKSYLIIEGYDPDIFYPEDNTNKIDKVLFFGSATAKRLNFVSKHLDLIDVYGQGWPEEISPNPPIVLADLRKTISKYKIVLNLVHSNIFSDRVVTTLGCGGFLLSEFCDDLSLFFDNKKNLVWFKNESEFMELVEYYLKHDDEREAIAKKGLEKVRKLHTWKDVTEKIVTTIMRGD